MYKHMQNTLGHLSMQLCLHLLVDPLYMLCILIFTAISTHECIGILYTCILRKQYMQTS